MAQGQIKNVILMMMLLMATSIAGCDPSAPDPSTPDRVSNDADLHNAPLITGRLISVTLWQNPIGSSPNEGSTFNRGRVGVYDNFIVVTMPGGKSQLSLHGSYSSLKFSQD